ncbi:MAG: ABC transporter permease [Bradymonadaceae bacterium]
MTRFIFRRLVSSLLVLAIIITVSLWITRQAPSNPCLKEREANTCVCVKEHALDRPVFPVHIPPLLEPVRGCEFWEPQSEFNVGPIHVIGLRDWGETQYAIYIKTLAQGSLGGSMITDRTVIETLKAGLPFTLQLGLQALIIAMLIGIPAGLFAGLRQNTAGDYSVMTAAMIGVSVPNFVLGPILILIFSINLGWFRAVGWETWQDSILPSITLGLFYAAYIARLTRGGMLEVIRKDYIRTARAKGLVERLVVFRHALKGALLPVITYLGPAFAALLTGSVVVEEIFNLPGIGTHFVRSALNRDYNLVLGTIILYSTILVFLNLVVDILYTVLDPRVSYDD